MAFFISISQMEKSVSRGICCQWTSINNHYAVTFVKRMNYTVDQIAPFPNVKVVLCLGASFYISSGRDTYLAGKE